MADTNFPPPPFAVEHRLPGWGLAWVELRLNDGDAEATAERLRLACTRRCRAAHDLSGLSSLPAVAAVRRLFRDAGTDPTRYRPSSEALLRRLLKGQDLPAIHPLVDLNNCLSITLALPACVMPVGSFGEPVVLRAGEGHETFQALRGPLDLDKKPLLADPEGPFGTPISDSHRVAVRSGTEKAWMVVYLPQGVVGGGEVSAALTALLAQAPVARASTVYLSGSAASPQQP